MNKKGFTLVEVLATLVILALVALISTPIISNMIEESRDKANLNSANNYISAAKNYYTEFLTTTEKSKVNTNIIDELEIDGTKASSGSIMADKDGNISMAIVIGKKCYKKAYNKNVDEIEVTDEAYNCKNRTIYSVALEQFPQLELAPDGCKNPSSNNYTYMNGCYLKGNVTNNYVWYSGFLWRIMGINADKSVKMVSEENGTGILYSNGDISFKNSYAENWLNEYYLSHLKNTDLINNSLWCQKSELVEDATTALNNSCVGETYFDKVGMLSLDEVNLSKSDSKTYLLNSFWFFTTSSKKNGELWSIMPDGSILSYALNGAIGIRPVININPNAILTFGNGTLNKEWTNEHAPYILNEQKKNDASGNLSDVVTSGEYVRFDGKLYRVVSKDSDNNVKLIYDGYYATASTYGEENDNIVSYLHTEDAFFTTESGIGKKLNNEVLNWLVPTSDTDNLNKMVTNYPWYQNIYGYADKNYKKSLDESTPTRKVNATVGLIRIGEMMSSQSHSILTNNYKTAVTPVNARVYWSLTDYNENDSRVWDIYASSFSSLNTGSSSKQYLRPVIIIKNNVKVMSGTGLPLSPYEI